MACRLITCGFAVAVVLANSVYAYAASPLSLKSGRDRQGALQRRPMEDDDALMRYIAHRPRSRDDLKPLATQERADNDDAGGRGVAEKIRGGQTAPAAPRGGLWGRYQSALSARPLRTKMITSGAISVLGDIISQTTTLGGGFAVSGTTIDLRRLILYGIVGSTYVPVAIHYWFDFLNRLAQNKEVSKHVRGKFPTALFMLSIDQTIGTALMNFGFFVIHGFLLALANNRLFPIAGVARGIEGKLNAEFWSVMVANWKIWPLANFVNFAFVPLELRVLFANVVAIFWNAILSASVNR
ncbi:unnamed protein product [Phaeothamnion confervicola]